jgi:hypothetical protein
MLLIIYHAMKQQEEVMLQRKVSLYQQNRTMVPIARRTTTPILIMTDTTADMTVKAEYADWAISRPSLLLGAGNLPGGLD